MCGIAGFLSLSNELTTPEQSIRRMTDAIARRGPDATGAWFDASAGIYLGHRRLSVLDLTPEGRQPMVSAGGRYVIVFNGEIYNYRSVRAQLEDEGAVRAPLRGHSDTEVMLAAFEAWGVKKAVRSFVGMFAFAVWDRDERLLHLVRDRVGEKPLYYGWCGNAFLFGSELKALAAYPDFSSRIDRGALALLVRYNCIPAPHSIYEGFYKLVPGTIMIIPAQRIAPGAVPEPDPYWSAERAALQGLSDPFSGGEAEAIEYLDRLLRQAVADQMVADVPLGAFLSGGIDSSLIVSLMKAQSHTPVNTFTIGFPDEGYDEAARARAVASYLGTEHTELYVTHGDALAVVPMLPSLYDEPFADSSQVPTYLVSRLARQKVTVSLSGDAGDELFGGYSRYLLAPALWNWASWVPRQLRSAFIRAVNMMPAPLLDAGFGWISLLGGKFGHPGRVSAKLRRAAQVLAADSFVASYLRLLSNAPEAADLVREAQPFGDRFGISAAINDRWQQMMLIDLLFYLPDDILVKVDRAAMGVSLETRAPLLDHRVVEFAWRLPLFMKIRDGSGKWLLKQVLYRYVPQALVDRPKMGFVVPLDAWLRGPLRSWAEELLAEGRLRKEGYFDAHQVRTLWKEHLSGNASRQSILWAVLMFQAWLENGRVRRETV